METWWPVIAGFAGQLIVAAFVYGRLSEKVRGQGEKLDDHEDRIRFVEGRDRAR